MGDHAIFTERERNGELVRDVAPAPDARCWQCGHAMPVKATPEMCPACHFLNFPTTDAVRLTRMEETP